MGGLLNSYHRGVATALPWMFALLAGSALVLSDGPQPMALLMFLAALPLLLAGRAWPVTVPRDWIFTLVFPLLASIPLFIGSGTGEALDGASRYFVASAVLLIVFPLSMDPRLVLRAASIGGVLAVLWNLPHIGDPRVNWGPGYLDSAYIGVLLLNLSLAQFRVDRSSVPWRALALAGSLCLMLIIVKTGTRGAWPAMICVLVLQFSLVEISRRSKLLVGSLIIALVAAAMWLTPTVRDRVALTVVEMSTYYQENNRASSVGYRLDFWDIALACFRDNPLWGVSYPRRGEIMEAYIADHPASASIGTDGRSSSHNEIMDALAKKGLVGVIAVLLLYLVPLRYFVRRMRRARDRTGRSLSVAGAGLVLTVLICGITEAPMMNVRVGTAYAFLLIYLFSVLERSRVETVRPVPAPAESADGAPASQPPGSPRPGRSLHLVRRYGRVGGMELYVWELTHSLAELGHRVIVICEQYHAGREGGDAAPGIEVIEIGRSGLRKPRWLGLMLFDRRASRRMAELDLDGWVIHSHERTRFHHVTTFHGPSIHTRKKRPFDWLSLRLRAWEKLERQEISGAAVRLVYPVSNLIGDMLRELYPAERVRIAAPAFPGVHDAFVPLDRAPGGKVIGFIGVEWERKGLDILVRAVARLRREDPEIRLCVAGCEPEQVRHLFDGWRGGREVLGWADPLSFYRRIDLLALPARNEPFGMVVAEANATGLSVVVSDRCGIAPLITRSRGRVVPAGDVDALARALRELLASPVKPPSLALSWQALAERHAADYEAISRSVPA